MKNFIYCTFLFFLNKILFFLNFFMNIKGKYLEYKYKKGEIVFGKIKGYPWWPGIVKYLI